MGFAAQVPYCHHICNHLKLHLNYITSLAKKNLRGLVVFVLVGCVFFPSNISFLNTRLFTKTIIYRKRINRFFYKLLEILLVNTK